MQHDVIQFHGSYRFVDRPALETALSRARAELDEEDFDSTRWRRAFITHGARLDVCLAVPVTSEHRFAAANMLLVLAHEAIDGAVEARHRETTLDLYASGPED